MWFLEMLVGVIALTLAALYIEKRAPVIDEPEDE